MKNILLILLLLIGNSGLIYADGETGAPKGKIKGAVVDADSKEPLEYATVALYSVNEDKLITGTITDYLGHFKLEQPVSGEYYLLITFIGLEDQKSEIFSVSDEPDNLNLGNFFLNSASKELGEVEIVSKTI